MQIELPSIGRHLYGNDHIHAANVTQPDGSVVIASRPVHEAMPVTVRMTLDVRNHAKPLSLSIQERTAQVPEPLVHTADLEAHSRSTLRTLQTVANINRDSASLLSLFERMTDHAVQRGNIQAHERASVRARVATLAREKAVMHREVASAARVLVRQTGARAVGSVAFSLGSLGATTLGALRLPGDLGMMTLKDGAWFGEAILSGAATTGLGIAGIIRSQQCHLAWVKARNNEALALHSDTLATVLAPAQPPV